LVKWGVGGEHVGGTPGVLGGTLNAGGGGNIESAGGRAPAS